LFADKVEGKQRFSIDYFLIGVNLQPYSARAQVEARWSHSPGQHTLLTGFWAETTV